MAISDLFNFLNCLFYNKQNTNLKNVCYKNNIIFIIKT